MGDYRADQDRLFAEQQQLERHRQHLDNLETLAAHFKRPMAGILEFIRNPGHGIPLRTPRPPSVRDYGVPPEGLSDPDFADWYVRQISSKPAP